MSSFDPVAHALAMRAGGFWPDRGFDEFLVEAVRRTPDKPALVADRADRVTAQRITYRELEERVGRAAAALRGLGIGPADVGAVQWGAGGGGAVGQMKHFLEPAPRGRRDRGRSERDARRPAGCAGVRLEGRDARGVLVVYRADPPVARRWWTEHDPG